MSVFQNPGFEVDADNNRLPDGWVITNLRIQGGDIFAIGSDNFTVPTDTTYPTPANGSTHPGDDDAISGFQFSSELSSDSTVGSYSLELSSSGTSVPYGVVRGPWVYSSAFAATNGQTLTFDWKAEGGGDAFDVFGFLINTTDTTASPVIVLDETGGSPKVNTTAYGSGSWGQTTNWETATVTIPADGTYRFVFLSGTYDLSGGRALGATLYLDNFGGGAIAGFNKGANQTVVEDAGAQTVTGWMTQFGSQTFTATTNNNALFSVLPTIAANGTLTFTPAANASGVATVTLTSSNGNQDTFRITITGVNDAPEVTNAASGAMVSKAGVGTFLAPPNSLTVADSDSSNFASGSLTISKTAGSKSGSFTVDGVTVKSGADGTLAAGETVTVNNTSIGTVGTTGQDSANLVINLNSGATPALITTLLRNLIYQGSDAGTVQLQIVLTDGDGGTSSALNINLDFSRSGELVEGAQVISGVVSSLGSGASDLTERKVISTGGQNDNLADGPSPTLIDVKFADTPGETVFAQFSNGLSGFIGASSDLLSTNEMIDMSRWSTVLQGTDAGRAHQSFVMDTQSTTAVLREFGEGNAIRFLYAGDFEVSGGDGRPMVFSIANTATEGITDVINISRPGTDQIVLDLDGFTGMAITGRGVDVIGSSENNYIVTDGDGTIEMGNGRDVIVLNNMSTVVNGGSDLDIARVFGNSFSVTVVENGGILYVTNGLGTTTMSEVEIVVLENGFYKKNLGSGAWEWVDEIAAELDAAALIGVPGIEVTL